MLLLGQDVLREKQQHIEQLLRERDLDRAVVSKAAGHVEEADLRLATLRSEYEQVSALFLTYACNTVNLHSNWVSDVCRSLPTAGGIFRTCRT